MNSQTPLKDKPENVLRGKVLIAKRGGGAANSHMTRRREGLRILKHLGVVEKMAEAEILTSGQFEA